MGLLVLHCVNVMDECQSQLEDGGLCEYLDNGLMPCKSVCGM